MYCLSHFCCLCFRNKVKLKLLSKTTCGSSTFIKIANVLIPEIQLSEYSHVTSVCEDCVNFVTNMHTFRRKCVDNNFLLVEYMERLSSMGGKIGNAKIEISDFMKEEINVREKKNVNAGRETEIKGGSDQQLINCEGIKLEDYIETKIEENEDLDAVSSDQTNVHCIDTTINYNEALKEEVEYKIEVNDDFNDKYGRKEEITNDNQLIESSNDSVHSPELQAIDMLHITMHTEERPYKCNICEKRYRSQRHLNRHNLVHVGNKPHECETCGKCFTYFDKLKRHVMTHTGEKPHECNICGQCFGTRGVLNRHYLVHTGEKPYKCNTCGKCFSLRDRLKRHVLIHTDEKPYKCDICGRKFTTASDLKTHNMIHTGEKPYECKTCGKCFNLPTTLRNHLVIHTGERPYECDICKKSFVRRSDLRRHKLIHS